MKIHHLIGIVLIGSACLLPVSYATILNNPHTIISKDQYQATIETVNCRSIFTENYITFQTKEINANSAVIRVNNLYPGAVFEIEPLIKNTGMAPIKLKGVEIQYQSGNEQLWRTFQGYTQENSFLSIDAYNGYLTTLAKEKVLNSKETLQLPMALGIPSAVKDLVHTQVSFSVTILFEQAINQQNNQNGNGHQEIEGTEEDIKEIEIPKEEIFYPPITGESTMQEVPEENVLGIIHGEQKDEEQLLDATKENEKEENKGIFTPYKKNHAHNKGELPKTGGISILIIWAIAIVLFLVGLLLIVKKDKNE